MSQKRMLDKSLMALAAGDLEKVSGGLIGPDQDIGSFPPWVLPYIRPSQVFKPQIILKNFAIR
jgi:hypothetical protein